MNNKIKPFTDYYLRIWSGTVFINNEEINLMCTPVAESQENEWLGGIQSNVNEEDDKKKLEDLTIQISERLLRVEEILNKYRDYENNLQSHF